MKSSDISFPPIFVQGRDPALLLKMISKMSEIRHVEEALNGLFSRGLLFGTCHLCVGQEAVAVGACFALSPGDMAASTHRGHGHALARGVDLKKIVAELLGKEQGLCRGRGGTQHLSDLSSGFLGTNGITGGFIPIATGAALAFKMQKKQNVVLSFFGDGASNTGYFHESLNFASVMKLPVVFICENNFYAMSVPVEKSTAVPRIADRALAYSMPGVTVDGMNPLSVMDAVAEAVKRARRGDGPSLIEAMTYRYLGHSKSDMRVYRTREEEELWRKKDPIENLKKAVVQSGLALEEKAEEAEKSARAAVDRAIRWALKLENPSPENVDGGLFS